jgi:hypothetical protein
LKSRYGDGDGDGDGDGEVMMMVMVTILMNPELPEIPGTSHHYITVYKTKSCRNTMPTYATRLHAH